MLIRVNEQEYDFEKLKEELLNAANKGKLGLEEVAEIYEKLYLPYSDALTEIEKLHNILPSDLKRSLFYNTIEFARIENSSGSINFLAAIELALTPGTADNFGFDSLDCIQKAAGKFHKVALYRFAYNCGNPADIFFCYSESAKQGYAPAQRALGEVYENGLYQQARDFVKAYEWYKKSAEQDDDYALNNIGMLYLNGYGVEKNYYEAFNYFVRATEKGNPLAQYNLGFLYENGYGIKKDLILALNRYYKALDRGNLKAKTAISNIVFDQNNPKVIRWLLGYIIKKTPDYEISKLYLLNLIKEDNLNKIFTTDKLLNQLVEILNINFDLSEFHTEAGLVKKLKTRLFGHKEERIAQNALINFLRQNSVSKTIQYGHDAFTLEISDAIGADVTTIEQQENITEWQNRIKNSKNDSKCQIM
ncbi:MAG: tetratricopeptide repeat protein [Alphaproteobacteria bacterium]